jgi:plastocyanin
MALPLTAHGATKQVFMGIPPSAQETFTERLRTEVNDFFPHSVTIRVGDSIRFTPVGFHNVDLPPRGEGPLPNIVPTGAKVAGAADAAGAPFWFNGQDLVGFNPALTESLFGKRTDYDGTERVNTGLPFAERPRPAVVRFQRRGNFTYFCDLHPGMRGRVRVTGRRANVPSARSDARTVRRMIARDTRIARRLARKTVPAGVVDVGEAGPHGVEYFGLLPRRVTVPVGTTLSFRMTSGSYEAHTATTGPGNPAREPQSYLGLLTASFESPSFSPLGVYPSDPPGAPASLTPQLHGNGFWNSGVMDRAAASPLPAQNSVRFAAPGTYEFYCLIHPTMHGTVTVTG